MVAPNIKTTRLLLRQWEESDLSLFAKINCDPEVMQFFPSLLTEKESNALAKKIIKELQEKTYGLWAVEIPNVTSFIGFLGLHYADFKAHFTPCVEIGWRLDRAYWGKGYATEGGKAVLNYAFKTLNLTKVVSFTSEKNHKSIAVMKRLGMHYYSKNNFEHPQIPKKHWLRPHVFYSISQTEWLKTHN